MLGYPVYIASPRRPFLCWLARHMSYPTPLFYKDAVSPTYYYLGGLAAVASGMGAFMALMAGAGALVQTWVAATIFVGCVATCLALLNGFNHWTKYPARMLGRMLGRRGRIMRVCEDFVHGYVAHMQRGLARLDPEAAKLIRPAPVVLADYFGLLSGDRWLIAVLGDPKADISPDLRERGRYQMIDAGARLAQQELDATGASQLTKRPHTLDATMRDELGRMI